MTADVSNVPLPVTQSGVLSGKTVVSVAAGYSHSLALCSDGRVAAWGSNYSYELGNINRISNSVPVLVDQSGVLAGKTVVSVSAGSKYSLALCSDGTIAAWGENNSGKLGNGSTSNYSSVPVSVTQSGVLAGKTVVSVSAGTEHSLALCSDGTVAAWGSNLNGKLGNNSAVNINSSVPVLVNQIGVLSGKTVVSVAAGSTHSLVLCSDGTIAAWGENSYGQLGNGSTSNYSSVPVLVNQSGVLAGKTVVSVASGYSHSLALCSDGTVVSWGYNSSGQLGNNTTTNCSVPVLVDQSGVFVGKTVVSVSAGYQHSLAVCSDGTVAAWGYNYKGLLGNSNSTDSSVPVLVTQSGILAGKTVVTVSAGFEYSLVLCSGPLSAVSNLKQVLINDTLLLSPFDDIFSTHVPISASVRSVIVNPTALDPEATVKVNGIGVISGSFGLEIPAGEAGATIGIVVTAEDGSTTAYTIHLVRPSSIEFVYKSSAQIPASYPAYDATGLDVNLLLGFAPTRGTDLMVVKNTGIGFIKGTFNNLIQGQVVNLTYNGVTYRFVANYYGGSGNDLILQWAYQDLAAWGVGNYGQLGNISTTDSRVPVLVTQSGVLAGKTVVSVAAGYYHSLALCSDGTLAAWGANYSGQLGNDSTTDSNVPVLVTQSGVLAGKTVVSMAAGYSHSLALCSDGTVASWGSNSYGQLGNNTASSSVPVLVDQSGVFAGKTVVSVSAGWTHSLALCSDGTVAAWGSNYNDELGNNLIYPSTTVPVLVNQSGLLASKTVVSVSAGADHSLALCSDGTVAAWGYNSYGQLGNNSTLSSRLPLLVTHGGVLVGKTVVSVAAGPLRSLALCSDGTVAAWGANSVGQLGNDSTTNSSVPVLVTQSGVLAGKTVVSVAAANGLMLCSDGTLAAWGYNSSGQLGNDSTTNSSVPVMVTQSGVLSGKTVVSVSASGDYNLAIAAVDNTSNLYGLDLSAGVLCPLFDPDINYYSASVLFATSSITMLPTAAANIAAIDVNGVAVSSVGLSQEIPLAVGPNTITVVVTAPDGVGTKTYTVTVTRLPSPIATLSDLMLSSGTLNPVFASDTASYTAAVTNATTSVTVRPTVTDVTASLKVNGTKVAFGVDSVAIPLAVGPNTITTVVTAQDGVTVSTYTVVVTRAPSAVSSLAGLTLSAGSLSAVFASGAMTYTASVSNATSSLRVTPVVTDSSATLKVNGISVSSGTASVSIPLVVGANTISTVVTAQDGTTTSTYTVTVTRAPSAVSSLAGLTLSSGTLSPVFSSATNIYGASVSNAITSMTIAPTVIDSTATLKVNGSAVSSGAASASIPLAVGANTISIIVTAQDGSTISTYTVTVTRLPLAIATLSGLTCNSGSLSPAFGSGTTAYTVSVTNDCTGVTLTPTVTESNATVRVNGALVSSGNASARIPVVSGRNVISVMVTAQDGTTTQTYTVTVTRPSLSATFASSATVPLNVASYDASGNFANLSLGYAPTPGTTLTLVKVTGLGFIQGRFTNLAQGQMVALTYQNVRYAFVVNYYGGTGNDLVLQWANDKTYAWGANSYGQLGNNGTSNSSLPTSVLGSGALSGKCVVAVSAGSFHSLALCADGTLAAWGRNDFGQLGNNSTTNSSVPVAITNSGALSGKTVVAISAGYYHNLALCSDGTVAAWGQNTYGQLGDGSKTNSSVPVAVSSAGGLGGRTVSGIAAGYYHNLVQCTDGSLVAWGRNTYGQLGNNSTTDSSTPVDITNSGILNGLTAAQFAAGSDHSLVLCADGSLAAWGRNNYGQLGEGSGANSTVPVEVDSTDVLAGKNVTSISAGGWHNLALCSDGTLAGFGRNTSGQLGDGGTTNSGLPMMANLSGLGGRAIAAVQAANGHSLALCADGSIYAWGSSSNGQLGYGSTISSSLPVTVMTSPLGSGERFMTLATGASASHSMALAAAPPTNTGFSVWAASHAGLSDSTVLGDPDKDGIPNVLEYVLNGNPAVASAAVLPVASQNTSSFLFSFSRAVASAADTTQVFQYSSDLVSWTDVSLTPSTDSKITLGAEDGAGIQPVTVTIPKQGGSTMFGRLKVTQP